MGRFAIWVEAVVPRGVDLVYGVPLFRSVMETDFWHEGPVCILTPGARLLADCRMGYVHVGSIPRQCWRLTPLPSLKPPFLITDDLGAASIFSGEVRFEPEARRLQCLDWGPSVPVAADSWLGVAVARRANWFRRIYKWTLFAVSSDPQARVESGPLHSPVNPDYFVGVLSL